MLCLADAAPLCMHPLPAGCLLSPSPDAAVVGDNVLTSQRLLLLLPFTPLHASIACRLPAVALA